MRHTPVILSVLFGLLAPLVLAETVKESSSGIEFPTVLAALPGDVGTHSLIGTGLRTKTFLKIKVYAMGLYVEPVAARPILRDQKEEALYETINRFDFSKTLRIVMARDVDGGDLSAAFDKALSPRLPFAAEKGYGDATEALKTFRGFFDTGVGQESEFFDSNITEGKELVFTCDTSGKMESRLGGVMMPPIQSRALCWSFFDTYIGEAPVQKEAKETLILRLEAALNS